MFPIVRVCGGRQETTRLCVWRSEGTWLSSTHMDSTQRRKYQHVINYIENLDKSTQTEHTLGYRDSW